MSREASGGFRRPVIARAEGIPEHESGCVCVGGGGVYKVLGYVI